ncbi:eukaryotic translation initiation factor 4E-1-like [Tripterygium wilfordii]|uniref:eukaryotic translation initiation factor 4E-1-like n=1 Tax=Tripterygium wilfordii TaxID=458696 RepID=UPI0018F8034B|nr:eukaryotic translation initiation factor 4E-1-like [Tripterygium wilfordii]
MGVEEIPTATEEQTNPENPPNDDDTEEGEIVGEEDSSIKKSAEIPLQQHPLEHSWTFWFDNLSAKSKQAAWGSSMLSIYTFATVEEFWR